MPKHTQKKFKPPRSSDPGDILAYEPALVHIERLNDNHFWIAIYDKEKKSRVVVNLTSSTAIFSDAQKEKL